VCVCVYVCVNGERKKISANNALRTLLTELHLQHVML
jgi:hypothetical protein